MKNFRDDDGKKRFTCRVVGTHKTVIVDAPATADELHSGRVLMGGIVTPVSSEKDVVIRGGFLIAPRIDQAWTWWDEYYR